MLASLVMEEPPDTTCRLEGWPELKTSPTYSVRCTECKHKSTRYCVICGWLCAKLVRGAVLRST
jgi:hypothetical protein